MVVALYPVVLRIGARASPFKNYWTLCWKWPL